MKKVLLLAAVAIFGFGCANAQRNGGRHRMTVEDRVNKLKTELSLTDEQTKEITTLYTEFQKKMKETTSESREQMRGEREKLDKQVEQLLTEEQKATFRQMQTKQRNGNGQRRR
ncbi:MAG: Spy/CpxP family protein refolding chaperone [Bacteroidales bacterium]|nr:Spy/CpxP family protein refolding chaperone [Bacteroidales bacterium]MCM1147801.1 Spy/CpxP family protein refolding chaperone [Bacteroidales bacterium]MCM1206449.1 Spy/CpxP family protein refolding chaperone [Bacillota bacterium]MCM1510334.1 Spy/CpxP family protein refolding chaperone [Clostridium sp.]